MVRLSIFGALSFRAWMRVESGNNGLCLVGKWKSKDPKSNYPAASQVNNKRLVGTFISTIKSLLFTAVLKIEAEAVWRSTSRSIRQQTEQTPPNTNSSPLITHLIIIHQLKIFHVYRKAARTVLAAQNCLEPVAHKPHFILNCFLSPNLASRRRNGFANKQSGFRGGFPVPGGGSERACQKVWHPCCGS